MPSLPRSSSLMLALLALGAVPRAAAQAALQDSPFLPTPGSGPAVAPGPGEVLQLSGISVVGKKTYVSIYDAEKKHSRWIPVGQTVDGLEVVSCDVEGNKAVIRVAKELKVLTLRAPTVAAGGPAVVTSAPGNMPTVALPTAPVAPSAAAVPLTEQAIQEREARMMVSDLLEIGQQQRKAYEEKKAAAEAAAKKDKS